MAVFATYGLFHFPSCIAWERPNNLADPGFLIHKMKALLSVNVVEWLKGLNDIIKEKYYMAKNFTGR